MNTLSIDIETYSSVNLAKAGVYTYAASDDFAVLLFAYSFNGKPVKVIDLASGEALPEALVRALTEPNVVKWAFNAAFERVCLSRYIGVTLDPAQWRCTMVWSAYLGLPMSLQHVGTVLGLDRQKAQIGKKLIRLFSTPDKQGHRPNHDLLPEEWEQFKFYCARDVDVEQQVQHKLSAYPMPEAEWANYVVDQRINDRGILIDRVFVEKAISTDQQARDQLLARARELTGLVNPNSPTQLQDWLKQQGVELETMAKAEVADAMTTAEGKALEMLQIRQQLAKSSVKKYEAMINCMGADNRAHGLIQFYGAGRTGRYAGRLIQVQNLPRNTMNDLDEARWIIKNSDFVTADALYSPLPMALSELIRTAFIPSPGNRFIVADYSAIEARVLAWLAGETTTLDAFREGKDLYCATASAMFGVPVEKHGENASLRQKGKIAVLACGYGGSVGALKAMGALKMGLHETELKPIVDAWRTANPNVVRLWWTVDEAVKTTIQTRTPSTVGPLTFTREGPFLRITLPSGRKLTYVKPRLVPGRFGSDQVRYEGVTSVSAWGEMESYGPKFVENIVQAIARDLLAFALANLEQAGLATVMHVHDEVVVDAPPEVSIENIVQLMCGLPAWAEGLPLDADGYECDYYKKD